MTQKLYKCSCIFHISFKMVHKPTVYPKCRTADAASLELCSYGIVVLLSQMCEYQPGTVTLNTEMCEYQPGTVTLNTEMCEYQPGTVTLNTEMLVCDPEH